MRKAVLFLVAAVLCSACGGRVQPTAAAPARKQQTVNFRAPELLSQDVYEAYDHEQAWIGRLRETTNAGAAYAEQDQHGGN
jgi:hypothetical protein